MLTIQFNLIKISQIYFQLDSLFSQFVCMGGTPKRMENFAHFIMGEIGYKLPAGTQLQDISAFSYRYSMYKVI